MEIVKQIWNFVIEYWELIVFAVSMISSTIFWIIKAIKNKKFTAIFLGLKEYMVKLDTLTLDGKTKKELALNFIRELCIKKNFKFNETNWSNAIEDIIKLSKAINSRAKDKK